MQRVYLYMSGSLSCRNQSKKIAAKDTFRSLCLRRRTYSGVRRVLVLGRIAAVRPQSAPCDESPERLGSDMPKRPFRRNAQKKRRFRRGGRGRYSFSYKLICKNPSCDTQEGFGFLLRGSNRLTEAGCAVLPAIAQRDRRVQRRAP